MRAIRDVILAELDQGQLGSGSLAHGPLPSVANCDVPGSLSDVYRIHPKNFPSINRSSEPAFVFMATEVLRLFMTVFAPHRSCHKEDWDRNIFRVVSRLTHQKTEWAAFTSAVPLKFPKNSTTK